MGRSCRRWRWHRVLREEKVTSVLIGASKTAQLDDAVGMLQNRHFTTEECAAIDAILAL